MKDKIASTLSSCMFIISPMLLIIEGVFIIIALEHLLGIHPIFAGIIAYFMAFIFRLDFIAACLAFYAFVFIKDYNPIIGILLFFHYIIIYLIITLGALIIIKVPGAPLEKLKKYKNKIDILKIK